MSSFRRNPLESLELSSINSSKSSQKRLPTKSDKISNIYKMFQEQGLDSIDGMRKFLELFRIAKCQSPEPEVNRSYSSLYKKRALQKSNENSFDRTGANSPIQKPNKVSVVKCQKGFTNYSQRYKTESPELFKCSSQISSPQYRAAAAGYFKPQLLTNEESHQYLYENLNAFQQDQSQQLRFVIEQQQQDKEYLMNHIKLLEQRNRDHDQQIQKLLSSMQKVHHHLNQIQTRKRQKELFRKMGEVSSPRSKSREAQNSSGRTGSFGSPKNYDIPQKTSQIKYLNKQYGAQRFIEVTQWNKFEKFNRDKVYGDRFKQDDSCMSQNITVSNDSIDIKQFPRTCRNV